MKRFAATPALQGANQSFVPRTGDIPNVVLDRILNSLRTQEGHDFSGYKTNMVCRRIKRQMAAHHIACPQEFLRYLENNPDEQERLFEELLIGVTSFFRDREAWEALIAGPLVELIKSRPNGYKFRA